MTTSPSVLADRLARIDWNDIDGSDVRLRISLMREFLRRSALWAAELNAPNWPFFDVAALIDPSVRADASLVEAVQKSCALQHLTVQRSCEWALHFAALDASGNQRRSLPNPFEPLVVLYENGGGFTLDGTGMIDIDIDASMAKGTQQDWLAAPPVALPEGLLTS